MQLIQREKMASVGQLVAGVAHELNNPIGFIYSNVGTLEDFVSRLRAMLEVYRAAPLPEPDRAAVQQRWEALKVDYALRYLDSMIQGIREGAERSRKIVRDLRVFARGQDEVWQSVDLHEEIESSLTLLNHLLKDRVTVDAQFGALPSVECIRSQIDQVFLNLLANAGQAIAGRARSRIETAAEGGHGGGDDRATPGRASPPTCSGASSIRSSPPSRSARAPGWGSRSATRSSRSTAASCRPRARPAAGRCSRCASPSRGGRHERAATVLLVDDEPRVLDSLEALLGMDHRVLRAERAGRRPAPARDRARRGRDQRSADAGHAGDRAAGPRAATSRPTPCASCSRPSPTPTR